MGLRSNPVEQFAKVKEELKQFAENLSDKKHAQDALVEGVQPLITAIKRNLDPHAITRKTEFDIGVERMNEDILPAGIVRVRVGAHGGKKGRAYILRFLELGTSHNRAYPVMRPALDSEKDNIRNLVWQAFKRRVGPSWPKR